MYRNNDPRGIYGTLSMQAALQLYLPHVEEPCELPYRELSPRRPAVHRGRSATGRRKRIQDYR